MGTTNRHAPEIQAEFDRLYQAILELQNKVKELETKLENK